MRKFLHKAFKNLADRFEEKSANMDTLENVIQSINTMYGLGVKSGIGWLSALGAINFYNKVSPIANAVDLIALKVAEVYLSVWDKVDKKYLQDVTSGTPFKMLELLKRCDWNKTYTEFMKAESSYYLITGNAFFVSQWLSGEPINVLMPKPQHITINGKGNSIPLQYIWHDGTKDLVFNLDVASGRYYADDDKGFHYEIVQSREFNPKENTGNLWGQSKLTQIYLEMEQHIAGAVHNQKLLANGARPSGVLTLDEEMSDDAYEKARAEVNSFYSGAENAGNVLIFEGQGSKFESFNISPKDMDFANLSEKNTVAIYNRLNIPLPLISASTMTYSNMSDALYHLYIMAVIPVLETLLDSLNRLLCYKYEDGERYEIHYDENDIDVMARVKQTQNAEVVRLGITTYNEARGFYKLDELDEGGDDVFVSPMLVPLGQPEQQVEMPRNNTPETKFRHILEKQNFDTKQIEEAVEKIYGSK